MGFMLSFRGASRVAQSGIRRLTIKCCSMSLVAMTGGGGGVLLAIVTVDSIEEVVRPRRTSKASGFFASVSKRSIRRSRAVAQSPGLSVA